MIRGCKFWPNASRGCIIFSTPVKRRRRTNPTTSPDSLPLLSHEHSRLRARAYLWHSMDFACNTLFREDLDQSPCSVASLPSFARTIMRMKDSIESVQGEREKNSFRFNVSMLDRTVLLDSNSRDSMHGSYVTRRRKTERKAIAIRNDEKKSVTGRNNLFVIYVVYARIDAKFRESFRGKKSAGIMCLLRAKRWRKTNIYVAMIYASNYFSRDSRRIEPGS